MAKKAALIGVNRYKILGDEQIPQLEGRKARFEQQFPSPLAQRSTR